MNNILTKKIAATFAGAVLSLTTMQIQSAQAVSTFWDLTFFNNSGQQVGTGEFSSDPEKTEIIAGIGRQLMMIPVTGVLDTFSAEVGQLQWGKKDFSSRSLWWVPNSTQATMGESIRSRFGTFLSSSWELKENDAPAEAPYSSSIVLSGSSTEFSGKGTWTQNQSVSNNYTNNDFLTTQGTWTAFERNTKSIPEGSLVLPLLGFGAIAFSRKLSRLVS